MSAEHMLMMTMTWQCSELCLITADLVTIIDASSLLELVTAESCASLYVTWQLCGCPIRSCTGGWDVGTTDPDKPQSEKWCSRQAAIHRCNCLTVIVFVDSGQIYFNQTPSENAMVLVYSRLSTLSSLFPRLPSHVFSSPNFSFSCDDPLKFWNIPHWQFDEGGRQISI